MILKQPRTTPRATSEPHYLERKLHDAAYDRLVAERNHLHEMLEHAYDVIDEYRKRF